MIVARMCGGLGNQMFQYALGRRLSLDRKTSLWLDTAPFCTAAARGETPRSYRLQFFRLQSRVLPAWKAAFILPFPRHLPRRLSGLPHWPGFVVKVAEQGLGFNPWVLNSPAKVYLDGYWQTEKYFTAIADNIRADFALIEPMTEARQAIAARMIDGDSISVHVRRGDYVTNPNALAFHGTCSPEWYVQAMNTMADDVANPRFFVFSDDPVWARDNLPKFEGTIFVDPQSDGRDYEDIHLMSKCRHHIIANSSFSWWGAWLNPSSDKKVIAPRRWFLAETDTSDRIPPSWLRL